MKTLNHFPPEVESKAIELYQNLLSFLQENLSSTYVAAFETVVVNGGEEIIARIVIDSPNLASWEAVRADPNLCDWQINVYWDKYASLFEVSWTYLYTTSPKKLEMPFVDMEIFAKVARAYFPEVFN